MIMVTIKKGKAIGPEPGRLYSLQPFLSSLLEITEISEGMIAFLPDEVNEKKARNCGNCGGPLHMDTVGRDQAPIIQVRCPHCGAVREEFRWTEQGSMSHHRMLEVAGAKNDLPR